MDRSAELRFGLTQLEKGTGSLRSVIAGEVLPVILTLSLRWGAEFFT